MKIPRLLFLLLTLCGLCKASSTQLPIAVDVPVSIQLDVPLVTLDFSVSDATGKAVTDLNRYDFEILDNGEPRPIQNFSPVRLPYSVLLLLDCSESTRDRLTLLVSAMARFADQLREKDRIAIAVFGTEVELLMDWEGDKKKPLNIPDSPMCHGTNFYSALDWAQKKLGGVSGRRGTIVFSDGRDSDVARKEVTVDGVKVRRVVPPEEDREFQKVLKGARDLGAPFYFVAVDTDLNPGREYGGPVPDLQQFRARLSLMADQTGGRIAFPLQPRDVVDVFLQISRDLAVSYNAGFVAAKPTDGKVHRIQVRVRGEEGYKVQQSRDTYTAN